MSVLALVKESDTILLQSPEKFDWDNPQSIFSYQIDFDNQQNTTTLCYHQLGSDNLL